MFVQWVSTVYVPRIGKDSWRFARKEMDLRPGSPTLTHTGNTDQVCLRASHTYPEHVGPWASWPLPSRAVCSPPRMSLHGCTFLGHVQRQPCAQDKCKGPYGGKCRISVLNRKQRHHYHHLSTVKTTFFFWVSCS